MGRAKRARRRSVRIHATAEYDGLREVSSGVRYEGLKGASGRLFFARPYFRESIKTRSAVPKMSPLRTCKDVVGHVSRRLKRQCEARSKRGACSACAVGARNAPIPPHEVGTAMGNRAMAYWRREDVPPGCHLSRDAQGLALRRKRMLSRMQSTPAASTVCDE